MTKKQLSTIDSILENEGLEVAILEGYLDHINDEQFQELLQEAKKALDNFTFYLDQIEVDV